MEEILKRIEQVEHMRPDCIVCAFNKYINRCPEDVSASKKVDYMQRVMKRMSTASKSTAIPVIIRDIDKNPGFKVVWTSEEMEDKGLKFRFWEYRRRLVEI